MNGGGWIVNLKADGENQRASMAGLTETHLPLVLDQFLLLVYFLALTESEQLNLRHQETVARAANDELTDIRSAESHVLQGQKQQQSTEK